MEKPSYTKTSDYQLVWLWHPEYKRLTLQDVEEAAKKELSRWDAKDLKIYVSQEIDGRMRLVLSLA